MSMQRRNEGDSGLRLAFDRRRDLGPHAWKRTLGRWQGLLRVLEQHNGSAKHYRLVFSRVLRKVRLAVC